MSVLPTIVLPARPNLPPENAPLHRPTNAATHGFEVRKTRNSASCMNNAANHKDNATAADIVGGSTLGSLTKTIDVVFYLSRSPLSA